MVALILARAFELEPWSRSMSMRNKNAFEFFNTFKERLLVYDLAFKVKIKVFLEFKSSWNGPRYGLLGPGLNVRLTIKRTRLRQI